MAEVLEDSRPQKTLAHTTPLGAVKRLAVRFGLVNVFRPAKLQAMARYRVSIDFKLPVRKTMVLEGVGRTGTVLFRRNLDGAGTRIIAFETEARDTMTFRLAGKPPPRRQKAVFGIRVEKLHDRLVIPALKFDRNTTTIAMATFPLRQDTFGDALRSLDGQADNFCVYLNNYRSVPDALRDLKSNVHFILDTASARRAAAKFHWAEKEGFHFLVDDDIIYPPDYVEVMRKAVERYGRRAIVGVHAGTFNKIVENSSKSRAKVLHFYRGMAEDCAVHTIGTGTSAFHSDTMIDFDFSNVHRFPIATDEAFAVSARRSEIPMVAVKRPPNWMKSHPKMSFGIFEEKSINPAINRPATEMVRTLNPWPEPILPEVREDHISDLGDSTRDLSTLLGR